MINGMYSVFDVKAGAYLQPFFAPTDGVAVRAMLDCLMDENHQFARHPEDFTLFRLGDFDDTEGRVILEEANQVLAGLLELKARFLQKEIDK